jgi:hypothetical protein
LAKLIGLCKSPPPTEAPDKCEKRATLAFYDFISMPLKEFFVIGYGVISSRHFYGNHIFAVVANEANFAAIEAKKASGAPSFFSSAYDRAKIRC